LQIADVLINLLIRDLGIKDRIKATVEVPVDSYTKMYEKYLNDKCNIQFRWNIDRDSKDIKYRDLTGPEKVRLFSKMDIAETFPLLEKAKKVGELLKHFFTYVRYQ